MKTTLSILSVSILYGALPTLLLGACGSSGGSGGPPPPPGAAIPVVVFLAETNTSGEDDLWIRDEQGVRNLSDNLPGSGHVQNTYLGEGGEYALAYGDDGSDMWASFVKLSDGSVLNWTLGPLVAGSNTSAITGAVLSPASDRAVIWVNTTTGSGSMTRFFVASTSGVLELPDTSESTTSPRWSPDGNHFLIQFSTLGSDDRLQLYDSEGVFAGSMLPTVGLSQTVGQYLFSPNGSHLAFNMQYDDGLGNYEALSVLYEISSGMAQDLGPNLSIQSSLNFSADSQWVAFRSATGDPSHVDVFASHMSNVGGAVLLSTGFLNANGTPDKLNWSPIANQLVYSGDHRWMSTDEVFLADVSGTWRPLHTDGVANANVAGVLWSPDGSQLAYLADHHVLAQYDLYITDVASGTEPVRLATGGILPRILDMEWSPDSQTLFVVTEDHSASTQLLHAFPRSDWSQRVLLGDRMKSSVSNRALWYPAPDSKGVVWVRTNASLTLQEIVHTELMDPTNTTVLSGTYNPGVSGETRAVFVR